MDQKMRVFINRVERAYEQFWEGYDRVDKKDTKTH
jgi:hypothetical protein